MIATCACRRSLSLMKRAVGPRNRRMERSSVEEAYLRGRANALAILMSYKRPTTVPWFLRLSLMLFGCGLVKWVYSLISMLSFPRPPPSSILNIFTRDWKPPKGSKLKFDDVIGCSDAKAELQVIVQFLTSPDTFMALGARPPRGILIVGPPGVGKTVLGRAMAGEAGVRCLMADGAEFGGDLSGEGALLVRELFAKARRNRGSCLVFIDGVEAACPRRDGGDTQTANQLLVEMDGLRSRQSDRTIVVLGTTSREDLLDPAVRRGGRFELTIQLQPPNAEERKQMFKAFTSRVRLGKVTESVWNQLTVESAGFTGADIINCVNRAAIQSVLAGKDEVSGEALTRSVHEVKGGLEGPHEDLSDEYRFSRAVHEAGHAVLSRYTRHAPPVFRVSIADRSHERLWLAREDVDGTKTRAALQARLDVLLAGRIAEEELLGVEKISTSTYDLEKANKLAEEMVKRFGMSTVVGPRYITINVSQEMYAAVDEEVSRLLRESCTRVRAVIRSRLRELQRVVSALEQYGTLDGDDLSAVLMGGVPKAGVERDNAELRISRWSNF